MGLDLYHFRVLVPAQGQYVESQDRLFTRDDFDATSLGILRFDERAVDVVVDNAVRYLYLVDDSSHVEPLRVALSGNSLDAPYVVALRDEKHIDDQLNRYQDENPLSFRKRFRSKDTMTVESGTKITYWEACWWGAATVIGLLGQEIGHQRKGMKRGFYDHYESDTVYADRSHFEKLLAFIDIDGHMYQPRNIEKNFVDKYVEGESFLLVSW